MDTDQPSDEFGEDFIRKTFEYIQRGQERSLIWTIENWLERSTIRTPSVLVNTDTLFPKFGPNDSKVVRFLPEVYACIDQLLVALTLAAADLHRSSEAENDETERTRASTVAEIVKCIATHVYTIRVLSLTGFDVQLRQIVRTYVEYVELLALVCADAAALDDFIASDDSEKTNAFWHRHLSKFKARKRRLLTSALKLSLPPEELERTRQWHEEQSRLLSESAHPTPRSVLTSGRVFHGDNPYITPDEHDEVVGSLIYTFSAFADALEIPTIEYLRSRLDADRNKRGDEICSRFYMIIMLSVLLGYRKDFVFFGHSEVENDVRAELEREAARRK